METPEAPIRVGSRGILFKPRVEKKIRARHCLRALAFFSDTSPALTSSSTTVRQLARERAPASTRAAARPTVATKRSTPSASLVVLSWVS